jgi:hypothetical protein
MCSSRNALTRSQRHLLKPLGIPDLFAAAYSLTLGVPLASVSSK